MDWFSEIYMDIEKQTSRHYKARISGVTLIILVIVARLFLLLSLSVAIKFTCLLVVVFAFDVPRLILLGGKVLLILV